MKKRYLCSLFCLICLFVSSLFSTVQGATFDKGRTVLVLPPVRKDTVGQYMYYRTMQPFRLPYYDTLAAPDTLPSQWDKTTFQNLSTTYGADIVLGPVVVAFQQWNMSHPTFDGDIVSRVRTYYDFRLLVYDAKKDTFTVYRSHYVNTEEESVYTSSKAMMEQGMDALMKKLPYKRIPTDVPRIAPTDPIHG